MTASCACQPTGNIVSDVNMIGLSGSDAALIGSRGGYGAMLGLECPL